jgi:S-adenosylmethionine decarboxylase
MERQVIYEAFGQHLTADCYGCDPQALANLDLVYCFLDQAPDAIGMTKIMPPYVTKYQGKIPEDWGLSGFVLIAESHISLHTFPDKGFLSLDIFSCKPFDMALALEFTQRYFRFLKIEKQEFDRGLEFPRNIPLVAGHIQAERGAIKERT